MEINNRSTITLDSTRESRITDVILYNDRAQITRLYNLASVAAGQTELKITNLPNVLNQYSVRAECRGGSAVVRDVMAFQKSVIVPYEETSPLLQRLEEQEAKASSAQTRCETEIDLIEDHMHDQMNHVDISEFSQKLNSYNKLQENQKEILIEGKSKLARLRQEIKDEKYRLGELRAKSDGLRTIVNVGVYAVEPTELQILLIYEVSGANWEPAYDLHVAMKNRAPNAPAPVNLIYRAYITQDTGEDWEYVSLTFKTTRNLLGYDGFIPFPPTWTIRHKSLDTSSSVPHQLTPIANSPIVEGSCDHSGEKFEFFYPQAMWTTVMCYEDTTIPMPGMSTVNTMRDPQKRFLTIADLSLEAKVVLGCSTPHPDSRVQIMASITNLSVYMFLPGTGSVYVDQNFLYYVHVPLVRPKEVFTCMLGFDPSIRITYGQGEKKMVKSGFFKKKAVHHFTRQILIQNKKHIPVYGFRITDSIHISKDEDISVTLISPPLVLPSPLPSTGTPLEKGKCGDKASASLPYPAEIEISDGITAMWRGTDQFWQPKAVDRDDLGKDGLIDWSCDIPAFGVAELLLEWKVTTTRPKEEICWL